MRRSIGAIILFTACMLAACGSAPPYAEGSGQIIDFLLAGIRYPDTDVPLAGGTVEVYEAGTSNTAYVWDNRAQTLPTTTGRSVITLDAYGKAEVYGEDIYKFVIKNSLGVEIAGSPIDQAQYDPGVTSDSLNTTLGYLVSTSAGLTDHGDPTETGSAAYGIDQGFKSIIFPPDVTYAVQTSFTVPDGVELVFLMGAQLGDADDTPTITWTDGSHIQAAPTDQIFGPTLVHSGFASVDLTYPQWWGATGDGITEDTTALQAAIDAASGRTVYLSKPTASYLTDQLTFISNMTMVLEHGTELASVDMMNSQTVTAITNVTGDTYNVACDAHGGIAGERSKIAGTTNFNGYYSITVVDVDNFTITQTGSPGDETGSFTSGIDPDSVNFAIRDLDNISIYGRGSKISQTKENYSGAFNHCVEIRGSDNIYIEGLGVEGCGGDGFYVGTSASQTYSSGVTLLDVYADDCRRQGLTIISGENIYIKDSKFTNTDGESPGAGIDIEPNTATARLINVVLENIYTADNTGQGIAIQPAALGASEADYDYNSDGVLDAIDIHIVNHYDNASHSGFGVGNCWATMKGQVTVDDPVWQESVVAGFLGRNWGSNCASLIINDPVITSPNTQPIASKKFGSAMTFYRDETDATDTDNGATGPDCIGSVTIRGADIFTDSDAQDYFHSKDYNVTDPCVEKVAFLDPVRVEGYPIPNLSLYGSGIVSDVHGVMVVDISAASIEINQDYFASRIVNDSAAALRLVDLSVDIPVGWPDITAEVTDAGFFGLALVADATSVINPLCQAVAGVVRSDIAGSTITVRRTSTTSWNIIAMAGPWVCSVGDDPYWVMPAGDATPSVEGGEFFKTANVGAQDITRFDSGSKRQCLIIIGADGGNTTIKHDATSLWLNGGVDRIMVDGDAMHLCCEGDGSALDCYEIGKNH